MGTLVLLVGEVASFLGALVVALDGAYWHSAIYI